MKEISKKISKNEVRQKVKDSKNDFYYYKEVVTSWNDSLSLKKENQQKNELGLRNPQIGAIHAVLAHWTASDEVATVVMPTGTGKTETMLALLVKEQIEKLLIIVPTSPLRKQIADKFVDLGLLKRLELVNDDCLHPIVGTVKTGFKTVNEAILFFEKCNVIVATASIVARFSDEIIETLKSHISHVFIDEAHHSEASTWFNIRDKFKSKKVIQFTATPYRNDDKKIGGKIIYNYPLKKAQEEGYFKRIQFVKLYEYDGQKKDRAIAEKAVEQLRLDKTKYPHILLARVDSTERAEEVFKIYESYTDLRVTRIHSKMSQKARKIAHQLILSRNIDVIVCVDMLGEGFDLPELKVAAFHDVRKSLPITLQFIGRFTRTKLDDNLGNATIVANLADLKVKEELDELYSLDVDWNILLPDISSRRTQKEIDFYSFISGFQNIDKFLLSMHTLKPAQSTVIFKNQTNTWNPVTFPKKLEESNDFDVVRSSLNSNEKTLVVVTGQRVPIDWTNSEQIFNFVWNVYIIYWETKNNLLFIHSSDNSSLHIDVAKEIIGEDAEIINGDKGGAIFRILSGISRLKLQNVGLIEVLGKLIRFVMRVGTDIEPALSQAQIRKAKKAMIFGSGYENGSSMSVGVSYKGRVWARRTTNLKSFTNWCKKIGNKVIDTSIDPEEVLKGTLISKSISKRPEIFPVYLDWNEEVYKQIETRYSFIIDNIVYNLYNLDLVLINPSETGDIQFGLRSENTIIATLKLVFFTSTQNHPDFKFEKLSPATSVKVNFGHKQLEIEDYFYLETPTIWFANGDSLEGNNYIELKNAIALYDKSKIIEWDWTGVDLKKESQGVDPKLTDSIQYKCISELKAKDYDVIYDDDGSGEIADIVAIKKSTDQIIIDLYHLKYAQNGLVGNAITNLYELCGQAQKSVNWKFKESKELLEHLLRRKLKKEKAKSCTRFEKGTEQDIIDYIDLVKNKFSTEFRVFIVQPGTSKATISESQLTLLSVTENYLLEKSLIPLSVITSA